jgi:hypothetical protein
MVSDYVIYTTLIFEVSTDYLHLIGFISRKKNRKVLLIV